MGAEKKLAEAEAKAEEEKSEYKAAKANMTDVQFERLKTKGNRTLKEASKEIAEGKEMIPDALGVVGESQFNETEVKKEDKTEEVLEEKTVAYKEAKEEAKEAKEEKKE